jgi:hypothetical protein
MAKKRDVITQTPSNTFPSFVERGKKGEKKSALREIEEPITDFCIIGVFL